MLEQVETRLEWVRGLLPAIPLGPPQKSEYGNVKSDGRASDERRRRIRPRLDKLVGTAKTYFGSV